MLPNKLITAPRTFRILLCFWSCKLVFIHVYKEFVVFALVPKNVLEKALEEVSAVLKEFQDVFSSQGS
jgi:hypothetical protein